MHAHTLFCSRSLLLPITADDPPCLLFSAARKKSSLIICSVWLDNMYRDSTNIAIATIENHSQCMLLVSYWARPTKLPQDGLVFASHPNFDGALESSDREGKGCWCPAECTPAQDSKKRELGDSGVDSLKMEVVSCEYRAPNGDTKRAPCIAWRIA